MISKNGVISRPPETYVRVSDSSEVWIWSVRAPVRYYIGKGRGPRGGAPRAHRAPVPRAPGRVGEPRGGCAERVARAGGVDQRDVLAPVTGSLRPDRRRPAVVLFVGTASRRASALIRRGGTRRSSRRRSTRPACATAWSTRVSGRDLGRRARPGRLAPAPAGGRLRGDGRQRRPARPGPRGERVNIQATSRRSRAEAVAEAPSWPWRRSEPRSRVRPPLPGDLSRARAAERRDPRPVLSPVAGNPGLNQPDGLHPHPRRATGGRRDDLEVRAPDPLAPVPLHGNPAPG